MHRPWIIGALTLLAALAAGGAKPTSAQAPATPYELLMSRDAAQRMITAWNERLPYVPGEVLVKFRAGTGASERSRAMSVLRAPVDQTQTKWIGEVMVARTAQEPDAEAAAAALRRQPEVEWAQPNYWSPLQTTPNDPAFVRQWNFEVIDMPRAWDINAGANETITVAVIDTGVTTSAASHPFRLWTGSGFETVNVPVAVNPDIGATRIATGRDFIFWTGPVVDFDGHGTHVAGTVLQETNNNLGLAGIAYKARLMPLKACVGYWDLQFVQSAMGTPGFVDPNDDGFCLNGAIAEAIRYAADNGAHVVNLSLGGSFAAPILRDAIQYAVGKGVFVSIAAGNGFESGNAVEFPAAYAPQINGAVSVGAVGRSQRRAYYSSTGSHLELAAPGGDVRDGGLGGVIFQMGLRQADYDPFTIIRPRFDRYTEVASQGTSMAAPHVAGLAALLRSQGITNPAAIEASLKQFSKDLGSPGPDAEFGHGLVDARAALRGLGVTR